MPGPRNQTACQIADAKVRNQKRVNERKKENTGNATQVRVGGACPYFYLCDWFLGGRSVQQIFRPRRGASRRLSAAPRQLEPPRRSQVRSYGKQFEVLFRQAQELAAIARKVTVATTESTKPWRQQSDLTHRFGIVRRASFDLDVRLPQKRRPLLKEDQGMADHFKEKRQRAGTKAMLQLEVDETENGT